MARESIQINSVGQRFQSANIMLAKITVAAAVLFVGAYAETGIAINI